MSLINQMLKDLERRSKPPLGTANTTSGLHASALPSVRSVNVFYALLFTAGLLLMLAAGVWVIKATAVKHRPLSTPEITVQKVSSLPMPVGQAPVSNVTAAYEPGRDPGLNASSAVELHASASIITGLTLQVQKENTLLRVLLSQDTLYRVSKNVKNEYVIVLEHARLVSTLPSINTINSAIDNIRMFNKPNGDLLLILTPKQGAELNRLALTSDGKYPELQMDFFYKEEAYTDAATSSTAPQNSPSAPAEGSGRLVKSLLSMGPDEEYQQALRYASEGSSSKAISLLTGLVARFPDYTLARQSLVKLLLAQGKWPQAKDLLQIGLKQHPFYPPYAELKARILVKEGRMDEAIHLLQQAAPTLRDNPEYHAFIAALYQRQGQSQLSAKLYEQLLPLEPDNGVWWMGLGIAYENLGKHNEALQAYSKADNSDTLSPELRSYVESRMHSLQ